MKRTASWLGRDRQGPGMVALAALALLACGKRAPASDAGRHPDAPAARDAARPPEEAGEERCGYLGRDGKLAIPRRFDRAEEFASGLAVVQGNKKVGFIDAKGDYVIPPKLDEAKSFREDLAAACVDDGGWGFVDRKGAWVIPPGFAFADSFSDGVAVVRIDPDAKDACFGQAGREVPEGSECESTADGEEDDEEPGRYFLIDRTGHRMHEKGYHCITRMSEGLAAARWKQAWGYLDRKGREAIPPRFGRAKPFGEGLAAVWMSDRRRKIPGLFDEGKWGFINRRGRFAILPRFVAGEVGVFSEGLIPMEGLPLQVLFDSAAGRACLEDEGFTAEDRAHSPDAASSCGAYLDKKGNVILAIPHCFFDDAPVGYRSFREFSGGFAEVVMEEPMRLDPFACTPALMGTVSTFVDRQGKFVPARGVLRTRSSDGLLPACKPWGRAGDKAREADPFIWR